MFISHRDSRKQRNVGMKQRCGVVGWKQRGSVVVVGWGGAAYGNSPCAVDTERLHCQHIQIYTSQSSQKKPLTSSAVSCSSLQDPPGSPFLNRPWETPLILECQLETWQSLLKTDANILFLYIIRSGVFIFFHYFLTILQQHDCLTLCRSDLDWESLCQECWVGLSLSSQRGVRWKTWCSFSWLLCWGSPGCCCCCWGCCPDRPADQTDCPPKRQEKSKEQKQRQNSSA